MAWTTWVTGIGGLLAVVSQFWGASYYLPLIAGIVTLIGVVGLITK